MEKLKAEVAFSARDFSIFWDQTVVKTKHSKVLAVQIEEKEKSLKEKAQAESFYTEDEVFFQLLGYIFSAD